MANWDWFTNGKTGSPMPCRSLPRGATSWYLTGRTSKIEASNLVAFRRGLGETGYVEGHTVAIDYRFANGLPDRLLEYAADLTRRRVAVIVMVGLTYSEAVLRLMRD
jgi:hypothetical protein